MSRIHTGLKGDGDSYLLFHDYKNECYVIKLGTYDMYVCRTFREALAKFKEVLYL